MVSPIEPVNDGIPTSSLVTHPPSVCANKFGDHLKGVIQLINNTNFATSQDIFFIAFVANEFVVSDDHNAVKRRKSISSSQSFFLQSAVDAIGLYH
jgi:hypothetical protein